MCITCNGGNVDLPKSPLTVAIEMAKIEAKADNKLYVVVESQGTYYHECYECRKKSNNTNGNIVAYVQ